MRQLRSLSSRSLLVASTPFLAPSIFAQQTGKPLRLMIPVNAGSGTDAVGRAGSAAMAAALGRPVVIENLPSAGGVVGTQALVNAPPDGSMIGLVSSNHVILPSAYKAVKFHPVNDVTAIALVVTGPFVLTVNPKVPANNAKELVALLKAQPDRYTYASAGVGTSLHLAAEIFLAGTGTTAKHIPYNGTTGQITDTVSGQVDFCVVGLAQALAFIPNGALRPIGVLSPKRAPAGPDIPTFLEQGFPEVVNDGWIMYVGPKGLPAAEVDRLNAAIVKAYSAPEVVESINKMGLTLALGNPQAAHEFLKADYVLLSAMAKKVGLEAK